MKNKKAFTLAELLVTLTIIGIIAALTIPSLQTSMSRSSYAEAAKKAFVTLSDVVEMRKAFGDPYQKWTFTDEKTDEIYEKLKPHLNIVKECKDEAGCWTPVVQGLNGGTATNFSANGYGSPARSFKLADGMNVAFDVHSESFNVTREKMDSILFAVDVNGDRKPNKLGEDIFIFVLGDNGLLPAGNDAVGNGDCTRDQEGRDCAARILRDGRMEY